MTKFRRRITVILKKSKNYLRATIAVVLIISTFLNITYAWLQNEKKNYLKTEDYISISADGLNIATAGGVEKGEIYIRDFCKELAECTSPDGKNIYFPLSGNIDTFRQANANDLNSKFIYIEFSVTSDKDTDVWISNESYIWGRAADAIRMAIVLEDGSSHILDSSESTEDGPNTTNVPTLAVDERGELSVVGSSVQESHSLSRYFYTAKRDDVDEENGKVTKILDDRQIMSLKSTETQKVIMIVWLEGADEDCVNTCVKQCEENECDCNVYDQGDLQINLKFTVGVKDPRMILFNDATYESWNRFWADKMETQGKEPIYLNSEFDKLHTRRVFLRDKTTGTLYAMEREEIDETLGDITKRIYRWKAVVPGTVENVEFVRLNHRLGVHAGVSDQERDWELWNAGLLEGKNSKIYWRYYATSAHYRKSESANLGFWSTTTSIITVYLRDYANPEKCDTTLSFSVTYGYYGQTAKPYSMPMEYVTTVVNSSGTRYNIYAARIPNAAVNDFMFSQNGYTHIPPTSRGTTQNMFSTNNNSWTSNSNFPTN